MLADHSRIRSAAHRITGPPIPVTDQRDYYFSLTHSKQCTCHSPPNASRSPSPDPALTFGVGADSFSPRSVRSIGPRLFDSLILSASCVAKHRSAYGVPNIFRGSLPPFFVGRPFLAARRLSSRLYGSSVSKIGATQPAKDIENRIVCLRVGSFFQVPGLRCSVQPLSSLGLLFQDARSARLGFVA